MSKLQSQYSFDEIKAIMRECKADALDGVKVDGLCSINAIQEIYAQAMNRGIPFIVLADGRLWDMQKSKEVSEKDWVAEYAADAANFVDEAIGIFLRSKGYDKAPGETGRLIKRYKGMDIDEEQEVEEINRELERGK